MSGSNISKRKRKRKTRAERNQMLKNFAQVQGKGDGDKTSKQTNTTEKQTTSNYTLRSKKGLGSITKVKDYKEETAATITQKRLIVPRSLSELAKTKSSEWIQRGPPIPETDSMKEKVVQGMKKMLAVADQFHQREPVAIVNSDIDVIHVTTASPETNVQIEEMCHTSARSQPDINRSYEKSVGSSSCGKTQSATTTPVSCAKTTPVDSGFSATSPKSMTFDDDVETKEMVIPIANALLKKPVENCLSMFNQRELGREMIQDIQKYIRQSKCHKATSHFRPLILNSLKRTPQIDNYEPPSALSSCRIFPVKERVQEDMITQSTNDDRSFFIFGSQTDGSADSSIFLPSTLQYNIDSPEPARYFCLNPEEMETDQYDEEDRDSGLSLARLSAFIASARQRRSNHDTFHNLNKKQCKGKPLQAKTEEWGYPIQHVFQTCSSGVLGDDCPVIVQQRPGWKGVAPAHLLGSSLFSEPRTFVIKEKDSGSSFCPNTKDGDSQPFFFYNRNEQQNVPNEHVHLFDVPNDCQHKNFAFKTNNVNAGKEHTALNDRLTEDNSNGLLISRHKLKTALQAACKRPSSKSHTNHTGSNVFSIMNPDTSHDETSTDFNIFQCPPTDKSDSNKPWQLSELHTHQVDLQVPEKGNQISSVINSRQAHNFLSNQDTLNKKHEGKSCPSFSQHRTFCTIDSPDSNGSPVWLASSVLKDIVL